jgi:histidyl-tRNA synthetase
LVKLYDEVFDKLGLKGTIIKLNNRKILSGIAEVIGAEEQLIDFTVALDKLDKIGEDGVKKEMLEKGISAKAIEKLQPLFTLSGSNEAKLDVLSQMLLVSETGKKGIKELSFVIQQINSLKLKSAELILDLTLARGLNYYTGAIFEVAPPPSVSMGSIGGGGRYDDLTGIFGLKNVSGVGISFGLDRIYLVLEELQLFPKTVLEGTKILFVNFGEKEAAYCMQTIDQLRQQNIAAELYPDAVKMGKQMSYADKRNIPYVAIIGEQEITQQTITLKSMQSGEQWTLSMTELINHLGEKL